MSDWTPNDVVRTTSGRVGGLSTTATDTTPAVRTWRGVPYGRADRFRAPTSPHPWKEIKDCTHYASVAAQPTYGPSDRIRGSEDCLNLDIVRPDHDRPLPVVVYFHGGSFVYGSSHEQLLRGHHLATSMDVVYVAINFRLGALGYLDLRSLGDDCVANPAILDQLLALKWIQANIQAFGGNPTNVTVMGESAGGAAVLTLMCTPTATGLFHKAIAQSPPIAAIHSKAQSTLWAGMLTQRLGVHSLKELRELPVADIIRAGQSMMWRSRELIYLNSCYSPTVDGTTLFEHPLKVFERGQQLKVPLLVGTNVDETSFAKGMYLRSKARTRAAHRVLSTFDPHSADHVLGVYQGAKRRRDFAQLIADGVFWAPSIAAAQAHSAVAQTWMYRFDFAPALLRWLGLGAMHSMELTPIFGDMNASRMSGLNVRNSRLALEQLGEQMQFHWARFIHHGQPSEAWPSYHTAGDTEPGRATMVFDQESRVIYDPFSQRRRAWSEYDMTEWGLGREDLLRALGLYEEPTYFAPLELEQ